MNDHASPLTRILFVDDSKVMLKTASKILRAEFDVVTAVDGDDAWGQLEQDHAIQVVFTDINMPGTDGYGLLEKIRTSDEPGMRGMPVILVTGADDADAAREKAMECGATDFIDKRALSAELLPRARAHAKYQRITRQLQAQATVDALTGLANEAGFLARLEQDIYYARRHRQELALMRVEIDGLATRFQDRGQAIVELLVTHVADLIRSRIRHEDTAGRIGLGGFAIAAAGGNQAGITAMAIGLERQAATMAMVVDGTRMPITLRTAVFSAEPDGWTTAHDAMDHCQALLDRKREQALAQPAPKPVAQPQPVAAAKTPEPVSAHAPPQAARPPRAPPPRVPAPPVPPPRAPAPPAQPARAPVRPEPVREQQAPSRTREAFRSTASALQRMLASLRAATARQGARLMRFLRNLVGR